MKRIAIISDTHGHLDNKTIKHIAPCDEIWHAGDIGNIETYDKLTKIKPVKAVFGNIDDHKVRLECEEINQFRCEQVDVMIKHIVGYPGKYDYSILQTLNKQTPNLLIAGHSHILKVIYDKRFDFLFINPGAIGNSGFHKIRTMIRLSIDGSNIKDLEVIEIER